MATRTTVPPAEYKTFTNFSGILRQQDLRFRSQCIKIKLLIF